MKVYQVGGSVRDGLLGLPVQDRDYVVVGAEPQALLAQGYKPVGADFPVFLHPETHEEYALARTERKSAPGYRGFVVHASPEVTLEQDLARRDLTVNAIAPGAVAGDRIDRVIQGQADVRGVDVERMRKSFVERSPLQRMSTASDIASLAAFLSSDGARNISGQCIPVTAGEPAS